MILVPKEACHVEKRGSRGKGTLFLAAKYVFPLIGIATLFFLIIIVSKDVLPSERNENCTMLGEDLIYPTILIGKDMYEWRRGKAILLDVRGNFLPLPGGLKYYGEIVHGESKIPTRDREMVSVFAARGTIYLDPENGDIVYIQLFTDWLNEAIVIFDKVEDSD